MKRILIVKELRSPTRDLPEGVVLKVGVDVSTSVADDLVRDGYAEDADKLETPVEAVAEPAAAAEAAQDRPSEQSVGRQPRRPRRPRKK